MNLWTEYEGRTIDGAFPLIKLIRPEGRSAFFSTPNGTGAPTVIRLIESHFDGEDILARWRGVAVMNHPNLVKLKKFGHVVVDETPLVYAVMETVDGNLGQILEDRRLTEEEAREVATSLLAAIEALHANGFVHEHVEAANVMAVGEVIKLRSDCIRETLEGEEGAELSRKDVRDYAAVLREALTQGKTMDRALPAPFDEIVRKGMSGEWGLAQIGAALKRPTVGPVVPVAEKAEVRVERPVAPTMPVASIPPMRRAEAPARDNGGGLDRGLMRRWIVLGLGLLFVVWLVWYFAAGRRSSSDDAAKQNDVPTSAVQSPAVPQAKPPATSHVPSVPAAARVPVSAAPSATDNWRVISYTYNSEDQAKQMVAEIQKSHPDLNPSVFTLTGHAPFLVALGAPMSKQDAFAFSGKAKREGLPPDTYAQNYRSGGR